MAAAELSAQASSASSEEGITAPLQDRWPSPPPVPLEASAAASLVPTRLAASDRSREEGAPDSAETSPRPPRLHLRSRATSSWREAHSMMSSSRRAAFARWLESTGSPAWIRALMALTSRSFFTMRSNAFSASEGGLPSARGEGGSSHGSALASPLPPAGRVSGWRVAPRVGRRASSVSADRPPLPVERPAAGGGGGAGSEWNQAGTWEEKDMTAWAKERLTSWLQNALVFSEVDLPSGKPATVTAKVTKVKSLTGEAQIIFVKKQPRHGYNFEADLSISVLLKGSNGDADAEDSGNETFNGVLHLPELMDAVQPQDLKIDSKWKGSGPSEQLRSLAEEWVGKLRDSVRSQVAGFRNEYQERR
mmetsp:Transcript_77032/g.212878  ORF Transcript_77032/g.212878 Transcript_77032/m.212878 type:complete len:363 (+) Transcript_77032:1030-2118(+)